jgi:hypothetical protein
MRKLEGIDGGKERGEKIERQLLRKAKKKKEEFHGQQV